MQLAVGYPAASTTGANHPTVEIVYSVVLDDVLIVAALLKLLQPSPVIIGLHRLQLVIHLQFH